jgi:AcrR family transcriptional regulator
VTQAPTRRERLRNATLVEIKLAARQLVAEHGPTAISLRAIGRELGMSAPALYRYFPSLEALVIEVCMDLYEELREAITAAAQAADTPAGQLLAMARRFRTWSVAHPQEFALLLGNPVPGVAQLEEECESPDHPGAQVGAVFLKPFAEVWHLLGHPAEVDDPANAEQLARAMAVHGEVVTPACMYAFLGAWTRLYGMVAMEVFGHLRWALTDVEPLFEAELDRFVRELTVGWRP